MENITINYLISQRNEAETVDINTGYNSKGSNVFNKIDSISRKCELCECSSQHRQHHHLYERYFFPIYSLEYFSMLAANHRKTSCIM